MYWKIPCFSWKRTRSDEELIQKIFRALHTIKGSGGMFGFDAVASFVHNIETVYDKIRNGKQEVTNEIIDTNVKSCRSNFINDKK